MSLNMNAFHWSFARKSVNVGCNVEISNTAEALHAHVILNGLEVDAGDAVLVHNAPSHVAFGESLSCDRTATVSRASWLDKLWVRLSSRFELTTLYEVSFSPDRLTRLSRSQKP
jgi:hypothetical protein